MSIRHWKTHVRLLPKIHNQIREKLPITKFSDLTHQEFSKKYLNLNYDTLALANFEPTYVNVTNVAPSNYDWRNQGRVSGVKDQASCGSCWALATVANLEGLYYSKKK